ncbi:hypothetical protein ABTX80_24865 [Streptomyces erythrochromogenes]|uniref:hypothetical protein n=1 Tax=Streptomyces erythrochromogenes TaxID=285574 RepID=UPI0033334E8D
MTEQITAPWTPEQVAALNRFQRAGSMHPFTCGRDHDSHHVLIATEAGWVCPGPGCGYTQDWAHAFMAAEQPRGPIDWANHHNQQRVRARIVAVRQEPATLNPAAKELIDTLTGGNSDAVIEQPACCVCGGGPAVYRNYRDLPFCVHCVNCQCTDNPCVRTGVNDPAVSADAAGYCPQCGRGDAAPTADQYEQQRQRAEHTQTLLDAQQDRMRKLANSIALDSPWGRSTADRIRAALNPQEPTP